MAFDPSQIRHREQVYLTQDCCDALRLIKPCSEHRDKWIEDALWEALSKVPGVVDAINERREILRKFKEQHKSEEPE